MERKDKENNSSSELNSPIKVASEILAIIILLAGGLIIEWLKRQYGNTLSTTTIIILTISEITLIIFFLTALIRAVRALFHEFDGLVLLFKSSHSWQLTKQVLSIIVNQFRDVDFRRINWGSLIKRLGVALLFAIIIVIVLLSILHIDEVKIIFLSNVLPLLKNILGVSSVVVTLLTFSTRMLTELLGDVISRKRKDTKKSVKR